MLAQGCTALLEVAEQGDQVTFNDSTTQTICLKWNEEGKAPIVTALIQPYLQQIFNVHLRRVCRSWARSWGKARPLPSWSYISGWEKPTVNNVICKKITGGYKYLANV